MALRGEAGWHATHAERYGAERWTELHNALHRDLEHVCFLNPFLPLARRDRVVSDYQLRPTPIPGAYVFEIPELPHEQYNAIEENEESAIFVEPRSSVGDFEGPKEMSPFFFVEGAAAIVAHALDVEPTDHVLELCAAPGGKALVLAASMFGRRWEKDQEELTKLGRLVCNESTKSRAGMLRRVACDFLPPALWDGVRSPANVLFTSVDARTQHNTVERHGPYDKILLDAPCTCDRTHLRHAGKLEAWSAARPKTSSEQQMKILYNALWWLKEGGVLLYCNSALSHEETDGVIERLILKVRNQFQVEVLPLQDRVCEMVPGYLAEPTDWGVRILPDKTPFGPVYFSRLRLVHRVHDMGHISRQVL